MLIDIDGLHETHLCTGMYLSVWWNFDDHLNSDGWEIFSSIMIDGNERYAYGVCDSPDQFKNKIGKFLEESLDQFVVSFVRLRKEHEGEPNWRWKKWGEYIGEQSPQCEYLFDEPVIKEIYTYHFYKRINNKQN